MPVPSPSHERARSCTTESEPTCWPVLLSPLLLLRRRAKRPCAYQPKEGDKLHYVFEQTITTTLKFKEQEVANSLIVIWDLGWNVVKVDGAGNGDVHISILRARMFIDGPGGKAVADSADKNEPEDMFRKGMTRAVKTMAAMELLATLRPTGEYTGAKLTDDSLKAVKALGGMAKEEELLNSDIAKWMLYSSPLPGEAVAKGKTWSNKTQTKSDLGKTTMDNTYTYEGPAEKDGMSLEKISLKHEMKLKPDTTRPIKAALKDFKGTGHTLFDNKAGRMIETVTNQRTEMQFEAKGMTSTQVIEQRVAISLKAK